MTGANRRLGANLVAALLEAGAATVYATARVPDRLAAMDRRVRPLALDVTDQASVDAAVGIATDVDLLVNNAGVWRP